MYSYRIEQDDDPLNPVEEYDLMGCMVFWHRRMNLGHVYKETNRKDPREWLIDWLESNREDLNPEVLEVKDLQELLLDFKKSNLVIPVYAYEHGGITISARKSVMIDSWDGGQLGFIYVTHDKIKSEYSSKRLTKSILEKAEKCLIAEIETYDDYLNSNVWGYIVERDGEVIDSCWGYYGDDGREFAEQEAKSIIKWHIEDDEKQDKLINVSCAL